jgi:hypothetical protein
MVVFFDHMVPPPSCEISPSDAKCDPGGLGTRLHLITQEIPKALVPIRGKPFAAYQLAWLAAGHP